MFDFQICAFHQDVIFHFGDSRKVRQFAALVHGLFFRSRGSAQDQHAFFSRPASFFPSPLQWRTMQIVILIFWCDRCDLRELETSAWEAGPLCATWFVPVGGGLCAPPLGPGLCSGLRPRGFLLFPFPGPALSGSPPLAGSALVGPPLASLPRVAGGPLSFVLPPCFCRFWRFCFVLVRGPLGLKGCRTSLAFMAQVWQRVCRTSFEATAQVFRKEPPPATRTPPTFDQNRKRGSGAVECRSTLKSTLNTALSHGDHPPTNDGGIRRDSNFKK